MDDLAHPRTLQDQAEARQARPDAPDDDHGTATGSRDENRPFGVDLDATEPPDDQRERAVWRAGRKLRELEAHIREARSKLREAGAALDEDRSRRTNAARVSAMVSLEGAGLTIDTLTALAQAKATGDLREVGRLLGLNIPDEPRHDRRGRQAAVEEDR